jgi:biopolymer transport protein ExbD
MWFSQFSPSLSCRRYTSPIPKVCRSICPKPVTAQTQNRSEITITLDAKGQIALNRQPAQPRDLPVRIRALMGNKQQVLVVINADERVPHGKVIAVMDQVRTIPGVKMAIAARRN